MRVNWLNLVTVVSAGILLGTIVIALGLATGWALAGLFSLGDIGAYVLQAIFTLIGLAGIAAFLRSAARVEPIFEPERVRPDA
jgi:hypothetical protein